MQLSQIGKCGACKRPSKLQSGFCEGCTARGVRWIELAKRVQSDPDFAIQCFNRCDEKAKLAFIERYGLPKGAQDPRPSAKILEFRRPT